MELLTEKFASKKLAAFAKQHGGIEKWINGGRREGVKAWYGNSAIDLSTVTDDMLQGEPFDFDGNITSDQLNNAILFNDGFAVALKPYRLHKQDGTQEPQPKKRRTSKYGTGIGDTGDHDKRPSPFITGGGKTQGQEYNPYGISPDTGYANSLRGAMANNKLDAKFYKDAGVQSRAREAEKNLAQNKENARDLLKTHDRSQIKPMPLDESELKKLVTESVKKLIEAIEVDNSKQQLDFYQLVNGKKYKYKVYVLKDDNEILTDLFIYAPEYRAWEPEASYTIGIEEYMDGTWLPYWETLNGDCSFKRLQTYWDKISSLWVKTGYKMQEDDEIPSWLRR